MGVIGLLFTRLWPGWSCRDLPQLVGRAAPWRTCPVACLGRSQHSGATQQLRSGRVTRPGEGAQELGRAVPSASAPEGKSRPRRARCPGASTSLSHLSRGGEPHGKSLDAPSRLSPSVDGRARRGAAGEGGRTAPPKSCPGAAPLATPRGPGAAWPRLVRAWLQKAAGTGALRLGRPYGYPARVSQTSFFYLGEIRTQRATSPCTPGGIWYVRRAEPHARRLVPKHLHHPEDTPCPHCTTPQPTPADRSRLKIQPLAGSWPLT